MVRSITQRELKLARKKSKGALEPSAGNLNELEDIVRMLKEQGWVEFNDIFAEGCRSFSKTFPGTTPCCGNPDKAKSVHVHLYDNDRADSGRVVCELKLSGELMDGTWIQLHSWNLPDAIEDGLLLIDRLLATWEFAMSWRPDEEHP